MRRYGTVLLFVALLCAACAAPAASRRPPNVVLIISDDQRWTDFGFMGHEQIRTPCLDALAEQSFVFSRGYVPSSLCRPSLASIVTGLYPHQHGITGNDPPKGVDRARMLTHIDSAQTLPRVLAKNGYRCLQTGKWWEGNFARGGFTHGMTHGDPARRGRHGDLGLKIGRNTMQPIYDFIDESGEEPFFVWYAPFLPHTPHNPPKRILDRYRKQGRSKFVARYFAMCEWFDETCGSLLDFLDRRGLAENTIVALVVDNGWIQRENGRRYAPRSKRSPYDGGLRTPILLRWPGQVAAGRSGDPVSSIDLAPTILQACGVEVPKVMPGQDLVGVANGRVRVRETVFGATFSHDVADIDEPTKGLRARWLASGDLKLIRHAAGDRAELFDVKADPHERSDLAGERPEIVRALVRRLDGWWNPKSR